MTLIEAAKLALEHGEFPQGSGIIHELRRAIAEAEQQEPVAWMGAHDHTDLYYRKPPQADVIPLYRSPTEREWQGLTDEEMKNALVSVDAETKRLPPGFRDFARAIEASLKDKNHDTD